MNPDPKTKRINLNTKEYTKLRRKVYQDQSCRCYECGEWLAFDYFSLHHKASGGMGMKSDDVRENVIGVCLPCHNILE